MILKEKNFRKELTDGTHSVFFEYRQFIPLSADEVFADLEQSLVDARKSWIWPDEFSVHEPEETPIRRGIVFITKYRMAEPQTGKVKEYSYRYKAAQFDRESRIFEYRAEPGHPFPGGGGIARVDQAGEDRCVLSWSGCYSHAGNRLAAEETFSWYFDIFFGAVEKNIGKHLDIPIDEYLADLDV